MKMIILLLIVFTVMESVSNQALWTTIYVGNSQVDLWTQAAEGCRCSFDSSKKNCACCVKDGGCPCGARAPHRCAQCGIQEYCTNMCNMTLDARVLLTKSGKNVGQLKSPAAQGPLFCWFTFIPDKEQRVEIQIYRLISVGKFNGTACESGYVQLGDGTSPTDIKGDTQICGSNERFTPPVLLFGDNGPSTLIFRVNEPTVRSQFMAYYSFTAKNGTIGAGFTQQGGKRLDETDCNWIFQESDCKSGNCQFSSPNYPGVFPPNRKCYYHITASAHTEIKINFKAVSLSHNHCDSDYIKIYRGPTISSPVITSICGNKKQVVISQGPKVLVEFSSGALIHPFDYNGFVALLDFVSVATTLAPTTTTTAPAPTKPTAIGSHNRKDCNLIFSGNETRSGHFDSRSKAWHHNCTVVFIGRPEDVVHLSLINFHLRAPSCQTAIEVYNNYPSEGKKPIKRICSPIKKHTRDSGKFPFQEAFLSSGNILSLFLRRHNSEHSDSEYVDGSFFFHDVYIDGTLEPDTICDVQFFGHSSRLSGQIRNPGSQHLFWNTQTPMRCTQRFIPSHNQSIAIKIVSLKKLPLDSNCQTACGDSGCRCEPKEGHLSSVSHLMLTDAFGKPLTCLCGDFQQEWLPVGLRSWAPINLIYSVAPSSWANKGFHFEADYAFISDNVCGYHKMNQHSGAINSGKFKGTAFQLNYYYFQTCYWVLDSNVERQLIVEIESDQNRPCAAWNITLHEYNETNRDNTGALLHTFCPRDVQKTFELPWKLNIIVVRLNAMTRIPPDFLFKWKSHIVRTNTRLAGVIPAQASMAIKLTITVYILFLSMFFIL